MKDTHLFTGKQVGMPLNVPLHMEKARQMEWVPAHTHEFIEIAFVAGGCAIHRHAGKDGSVRTSGLIQGDLFSIQIGECHTYERCGSMLLYNIFLKPAFLAPYRKLSCLPGWELLFGPRSSAPEHGIHLSPATRAWAAQSLDRAVRECKFTPPGYDTIMSAQVLEFLITAMRCGKSTGGELGENSVPILESISRMEAAPEQHFTLDQLAGISHMSVPSYTKKFRQATGVSPMEYLLKIRIQLIEHYLKKTDYSIGEIAEKCGFCSANYLIKLFRREFNITPTQYRENDLQKE